MVTAMATNFGTEIAITAFVWTIATRQLVMEGVWVVGQQNADIVDTLQLRDVPMATIFVFLYIGCTLATPGEYNWTVRVRRQCDHVSNYFDHLLFFHSLHRARHHLGVNSSNKDFTVQFPFINHLVICSYSVKDCSMVKHIWYEFQKTKM